MKLNKAKKRNYEIRENIVNRKNDVIHYKTENIKNNEKKRTWNASAHADVPQTSRFESASKSDVELGYWRIIEDRIVVARASPVKRVYASLTRFRPQ